MMGNALALDQPALDSAVVVALGGNLPGAHATVQAGLEAAVRALPGAGFRVLARSRWWRSAAWPDPADPPFLNGVVLAQTALPPLAALAALKGLERGFGRRPGARNAPRPLDLDLIAYGRRISEDPQLILPHPRAHERLFVMGPLAEIAPLWRHPALRRTARELAASARVGADAAPVA